MNEKKRLLYWIMNYLIYGYGIGLLILSYAVKANSSEEISKFGFFIVGGLVTSIFTFPVAYFIKKEIVDTFKIMKGSTIGVKIFLILAFFGVLYRTWWDYNRHEKARVERKKTEIKKVFDEK